MTTNYGREAGGYMVYREDVPGERDAWEKRNDPSTVLAGDERSEYALTLTPAQAKRMWERDDAGLDWRLPTPTAKIGSMRGLRVQEKRNAAGYRYVSGWAMGDWAAVSDSGARLLHVPSGLFAPTRGDMANAKRLVAAIAALPVRLGAGYTWDVSLAGGKMAKPDLHVIRALIEGEPVTDEMLEAVYATAARDGHDATPIAADAAPAKPVSKPVRKRAAKPVAKPAPVPVEAAPVAPAKPKRKRAAKPATVAPAALTVEAVTAALTGVGGTTAKMAARVATAYVVGITPTAHRPEVAPGDAHAAMAYGCGPSSVGRRRGDAVLAALAALTGAKVTV